MAKDSFLMYSEWGEQLNKLSDEQAGTLIKNIFAYKTGTEAPQMDSMTEMCFSFIKSQIERDSFKYDEICEKRREAGRKGGKANGSKCKQMQANANFAKHYDNDNDNDNEYEDDNDNDDDVERKKERDRLLAEDDYALRHEDDGRTYFEPRVKLGWKKTRTGHEPLTQEQKDYWTKRALEFQRKRESG
jgi:hypothetical protein